MRKNILLVLLGMLIMAVISVGVYAINANEIIYKNTTVDAAIDDLYSKINSLNAAPCLLSVGTSETIGSMYVCNLGDNIVRKLYVLKVNENTVDLILDRNINSDKLTYSSAMTYFSTGAGKNIISNWDNVESVSIPKAQDIANAANIAYWDVTTVTNDPGYIYFGGSTYSDASNRSNYKWLYNYTRDCSSYGCDANTSLTGSEAAGYWTADTVSDNSSRVWRAGYKGYLATVSVNNTETAIRPVVTILKSNLQG